MPIINLERLLVLVSAWEKAWGELMTLYESKPVYPSTQQAHLEWQIKVARLLETIREARKAVNLFLVESIEIYPETSAQTEKKT